MVEIAVRGMDAVEAGMLEEIGQSMEPEKTVDLARENPALAEFISNSVEEKKVRDRMGNGYTFGDSRGRSKGMIDLLSGPFSVDDPVALLNLALAAMTMRNDSMGKSGSVQAWARATQDTANRIGH
ncbi:MAG: hypothetical protein P8104_02720 [Gammaproteobacteria bacterium]